MTNIITIDNNNNNKKNLNNLRKLRFLAVSIKTLKLIRPSEKNHKQYVRANEILFYIYNQRVLERKDIIKLLPNNLTFLCQNH